MIGNNRIIEVKNLQKSYGDVHAVKDISFYVEEGKLFAFFWSQWSREAYYD